MKTVCPTCNREVSCNADGSLRKHPRGGPICGGAIEAVAAPSSGNLDEKSDGRRTLIYEDGLHVATLFEIGHQGKDHLYQWYTAHAGSPIPVSFVEARMAIQRELAR